MASPDRSGVERLIEVADRVWLHPSEPDGCSVTVVGGGRGLLVVDTTATPDRGAALVDDLRRLGAGAPVAVVNTHHHRRHVGGNGRLQETWPSVLVHAHEEAAPHLERVDRAFASVLVLDLGDRVVELVHPGRGHTAGDVVVRVPDVDLLVAGDLVSASRSPGYGPDCFPLDWPGALDFVVGLLTPESVVVPGHGAPVDLRFVQEQRGDVGTVAEAIFDLASRMVPFEEALTTTEWPFPPDSLREALRRGYDQVPRTSRRLPLV